MTLWRLDMDFGGDNAQEAVEAIKKLLDSVDVKLLVESGYLVEVDDDGEPV